jgi:hypothetical protein
MVRKMLLPLVAAVALATAGTAAAGNSTSGVKKSAAKPDVACLATGIGVLQANGGVAFFARNGVPLSLIGGEGTLPLATVLKLHLFQPELFPWCNS